MNIHSFFEELKARKLGTVHSLKGSSFLLKHGHLFLCGFLYEIKKIDFETISALMDWGKGSHVKQMFQKFEEEYENNPDFKKQYDNLLLSTDPE